MRRTLESVLTVALIVLTVAIAAFTLQLPAAEAQSQPPGVRVYGNNPANGRAAVATVDDYGVLFARPDHPARWLDSHAGIGATLTQVVAAPAATLSLYVTGYIAGSTTTTAGQHLPRQGTGTNCGTGTATLYPGSANTTATVPSPANTVAPTSVTFNPPLKLAAGRAFCILGVATNTTWIAVSGFTAP
jgi:hypothetical protein